jgi:integrase
MAWARKHEARDGTVTWFLTLRNPRAGEPGQPRYLTRALGAISEERARAEAATARQVDEGKPAKRTQVTPLGAVERFLAYWRSVRHRTEATLRFYRKLLSPLFAWLAERADMRTWSGGHLLEYLEMMQRPRPVDFGPDGQARRTSPGWSAASQAKLVVASKAFCRWARVARLDIPDFAAEVEPPECVTVESKAYSAAEMEALRAAVGKSLLPWLRLSFWLAYEAGLSLGDLRSIVWPEVHFADGFIRRLRSKTKRKGQMLELPMSARLRAVLLAERATQGFVCRGMPISDSSINQAWWRLCRRAGVDGSGGLKRLRHTYLTELAAAGADPATLRELAGHAPRSTQIMRYLHTDPARKREAIDRRAEQSVGARAGGRHRAPRAFHAATSIRRTTGSESISAIGSCSSRGTDRARSSSAARPTGGGHGRVRSRR